MVDPFDHLQEFIEARRRGASAEELKRLFEDGMRTMGFRCFAICSHVDPLDPPGGAVMYHTYPQPYVVDFSQRKLQAVDPVFQYASAHWLPFGWDESDFCAGLTPIQRTIITDARCYGISGGYTVPFHGPGLFPGSCSLVPDSASLDYRCYGAASMLSSQMYDALGGRRVLPAPGRLTPTRLSRRERECISSYAQGHTVTAIAAQLHIAERTVHVHFDRARKRLGVRTRVEAVVHALWRGQIALRDAIRQEFLLQCDSPDDDNTGSHDK